MSNFQLYHDEYKLKLHFDLTNPQSWIFIVLALMKLQYAVEHVAPLGQIMIPIQTVFAPFP